ncbi:alpha/beta hydrolase [Actinomadura luteofluorescens]|uniref:alpha/beta hydrolase n=1 Tax=Actinomadura luteofluorescens TaxID=46163 RepID=UPI002164E1C6|nr:alpha/beta hydrolase [Actinomadura glauciflava]
MRIDIGGVRLYFDVEGAGLVPDGTAMAERPVIVALHGGPGADHSMFKPVLGRATEFAQVVYLDQRGSGRSDVSGPALWTWERWADDVVDFCDALEIDAPVVLGTSSGGWVALTIAHRHPERVAAVVLDSVMPGPAGERLEVFERLGGAEARDIARRYWDGEDVQDEWQRVCLPLYSRRPGGDPEARDRLARIRWNRDVIEHFRHSLAAAFDPWPHLDRVVPARSGPQRRGRPPSRRSRPHGASSRRCRRARPSCTCSPVRATACSGRIPNARSPCSASSSRGRPRGKVSDFATAGSGHTWETTVNTQSLPRAELRSYARIPRDRPEGFGRTPPVVLPDTATQHREGTVRAAGPEEDDTPLHRPRARPPLHTPRGGYEVR